MLMKHLLAATCMAVAVLLLSGCEQRIGDFTFLSTKNIDLSNVDIRPSRADPEVEGVDSKWIVIVWGTPPSLKEAIDRAIEEGGGTALVDASLYVKHWWVPYIVGQTQFRVEGKVVGK